MKDKRVLGIVNWYSQKDRFGAITSNTKNIIDFVDTSISFFISYTELKKSISLEKGDWVSFIPGNNQDKDIAVDIKKLSLTKEDIALAFEYRKEFTRIIECDKKNLTAVDAHVIESIYNFVNKLEPGSSLFKTAFYEYIGSIDEIYQDFIIYEFLEDEISAKVIIDAVQQKIPLDKNLKVVDEKIKKQLFTYMVQLDNLDWNVLGSFSDLDILERKRDILKLKIQHDSVMYRQQIRSFFTQIGIEGITVIFGQINSLEVTLLEDLYDLFKEKIFSLVQKNQEIGDELCFLLFSFSKNEKYLHFKNREKIINWLSKNKNSYLEELIKKIIQTGGSEIINNFLLGFDPYLLANIIKSFLPEEQNQLLDIFPAELAIKIVNTHILNCDVTDVFLSNQWELVKSEVPYVVFDLEIIEDKQTRELNIASFAFSQEGNIREYEGEDQLGSLGRALKRNKIIVGHNIKQWDLPELSKKGIEPQGFIWDTLEMEILLNPCRYAYSLKTEHKAKYDTLLTEELFWNQLYRLAQQRNLCNRLNDFLPENIALILEKLSLDYYKDFFYKTANSQKQFFQELLPVDVQLEKELKQLATLKEKILVVAPKNLWGRLAHYLSLHFISSSEEKEFFIIDAEKIKNKPFGNLFVQTALLRFCEEICTPIIGNLAIYLRIAANGKIGFSDEDLYGYLSESKGRFDCVDIDSFDNEYVLSQQYQKIYLIGSELQDRIHCQCIRDNISITDLIYNNSQLPMQMESCNYVKLNKSDYEAFQITREDDNIANTWIERKPNGEFAIYQNYKYRLYRDNFLRNFSGEKIEFNWKFDRQKVDVSPCFVRSAYNKKFDYTSVRVNSSAPYRSKYWVYQTALLKKISNKNPEQPIIYIIDDSVFNDITENQALHEYLCQQEFYIPREGTGFRKLEYISQHKNSLIIISKSDFINSYSLYRSTSSFSIVWDNLEIDRYKLMWETLPFEKKYKEIDDEDEEDTSKGTTAKQCIISFLPVLEYYYSLALANNSQTKFYIIEPYLDDFNDFDEKNNINRLLCNLWKNEEEYNHDLKKASDNFINYNKNDNIKLDTKTAMTTISKFFIDGKPWREEQKQILPFMLEKKGDCLVSIPTGGGKSVLFQGPIIYRAMIYKKLSIVITPLRALMQDQVYDLQKKSFGSSIDYISADRSFSEIHQIYRRIRSGEISLLYITPERFRVQSFVATLNQRMESDSGLDFIIFDEAHCISQWGNDFRPDYYKALNNCLELKKKYVNIVIALFSATFTMKEEKEIQKFLPDIKRLGQAIEDYNPIRQHITVEFKLDNNDNDESKVNNILEYITTHKIDFEKSKMLIFCRKRKECEEVAENLDIACKKSENTFLQSCAGHIGYYHAGLNDMERADTYNQFKKDSDAPIYILCATKAFGMGMDIPNIHYIIHYSSPSVLEDYLQEVGRAGRDEKLYRETFLQGEKIPACCLVTEKDFKRLKELLLNSLIGWSDLSNAKEKILEYISQFRDIQAAQHNPVVVPNDVWLQDEYDLNNVTATRLVFYWLETIKYIKQGFLKPAHLDITFLDKSVSYNELSSYSSLYHALTAYKKDSNRVQIPLQDLKDNTALSLTRIIDGCLYLSEYGYFTLNETMRCFLTPRRTAEAKYMEREKNNSFALYIRAFPFNIHTKNYK